MIVDLESPLPQTVMPNLEEPLPMIPWLSKVSMVAPFWLLVPILTLAVLFPPIRVPWFLKVVVEESWVKLTAWLLEIVIVPPLPITRVLSVPLQYEYYLKIDL